MRGMYDSGSGYLDSFIDQAGLSDESPDFFLELDEYADAPIQEEVNRGSNDYIRWVQRSLNQVMNTRLAEDGVMGPLTRSTIRSFQSRKGLTVDGIVGPVTERALVSAGAAPYAGGSPAPRTPSRPAAGAGNILVGGVSLRPPQGLSVTNYLDPGVHHFRGRNRRGSTVNELVIHETVTTSVTKTVEVLKARKLSVHFIIGPDGRVTQYGDLADEVHAHAAPHNNASVGVEVVTPYYPENTRPDLPWKQSINAGWAHKGRYLLPTPQQSEAVTILTKWLTSPSAGGLSIPRDWIGVERGRIAMGRKQGADRPAAGIYAHTYFNHADGSWLVLYTWLRLAAGFSPDEAYRRAAAMAAVRGNEVTLLA